MIINQELPEYYMVTVLILRYLVKNIAMFDDLAFMKDDIVCYLRDIKHTYQRHRVIWTDRNLIDWTILVMSSCTFSSTLIHMENEILVTDSRHIQHYNGLYV